MLIEISFVFKSDTYSLSLRHAYESLLFSKQMYEPRFFSNSTQNVARFVWQKLALSRLSLICPSYFSVLYLIKPASTDHFFLLRKIWFSNIISPIILNSFNKHWKKWSYNLFLRGTYSFEGTKLGNPAFITNKSH